MKKIFSVLLIGIYAFGLDCSDSNPYKYGAIDSCKQRAKLDGKGVTIIENYNHLTGQVEYNRRSNDEIYNICKNHLFKNEVIRGTQYENIFMNYCAQSLGYRF
ncbi:hypothetical protein [Aliarcobacter butzleri]|uniref:hypothetical protein n=1 Tax=Aliarcobacter butzleri TaxID=28197 RepID=UPI001ED9D807|nr:hypothetical protein [Aliarcobacter butzleri]MCG3683863.1 hypothetical protein [Aliarcobacter butzleri]